jgi:hypothetical protein
MDKTDLHRKHALPLCRVLVGLPVSGVVLLVDIIGPGTNHIRTEGDCCEEVDCVRRVCETVKARS